MELSVTYDELAYTIRSGEYSPFVRPLSCMLALIFVGMSDGGQRMTGGAVKYPTSSRLHRIREFHRHAEGLAPAHMKINGTIVLKKSVILSKIGTSGAKRIKQTQNIKTWRKRPKLA